MLNQRTSGILLHPTSLPGKFGSGDFGAAAYQFVDWLERAGQTYWQVLPLGKIGPGNSPYMSSSAFAGNILLIDLEELASHGWLTREEIVPHPEFSSYRIDYALLHAYRMERLRRAAERFFAGDDMHAYVEFCAGEKFWLDDYALFMAIAEHEDWREWSHWPEDLVHRKQTALQQAEKNLADAIAFWKFCQWSFARQWSMLKGYANRHGVKFIGDVPIFVAYQSADVWAHQELFELDENCRPTVVAGVPPDYFSNTGQLWGNPLYRWDVHEKTGFSWWISRLRHAIQQTDLVRIDHFRGFVAYWEVPANAINAMDGKWQQGPGEKLFNAILNAFPKLPIIAEDLGVITPDVVRLRDKFELPGMCILQFAFSEGENNPHLPHNYRPNIIAYTGTHDNDTSAGWWESASEKEKAFAQHYLGSDGKAIQCDMMRALAKSAANTVIYPMQDVLGLLSDHRMNFPGQPTGNWEWRFSWDQVKPEITQALAKMAADHDRIPHKSHCNISKEATP